MEQFSNNEDEVPVEKTNHELKDKNIRKRSVCPICGKDYKSLTHLNVHLRTHTGEKPYKCTLCEFRSAQPINRKHKRSHEPKTPKPLIVHTCNYCGKQAQNKAANRIHERTHTGEKPFHCNFCDFRTAQKCGLEIHVRMHTGEKPFECNLCEYRSSQKSGVTEHMKAIHLGTSKLRTSRYKCRYCDRDCGKQSQLINHERTHTGEKPYECNLCDYRAAVEARLREHMGIHTGKNKEILKKHECSYCGKLWQSKSRLLTHERTHTGEKPFKCNLCDFRAAQQKTVDNHVRIHHTEISIVASHSKNKTSSNNGTVSTESLFDISDSDTGLNSNEVSREKANLKTLLTTSEIPLTVVVNQRLLIRNEEIMLIWLKRMEPDVLALAKINPSKCIVFVQNDTEIFSKHRFVKLNNVDFSIKLLDDTVLHWKMYSFGHSEFTNELKDKEFKLYDEVETIICASSKATDLINFVRYSEIGFPNQMINQLRCNVLICNSNSE